MKLDRNREKPLLIKLFPGIIISVAIIFVLTKIVDFEEALQELNNFSPWLILVIFLLTVLSIVIRGLGWRSLLGNRISLKDSFFIIAEGYLLNNIIPRSGEIGRALILNGTNRIPFFHGISTIMIERLLDLSIASIMFLSTISIAISYRWIETIAYIVLLFVVGLIGIFILYQRNRKYFDQKLINISQKNKILEKFILYPLRQIIDGLEVLNDFRMVVQSVLWIIFSWCIWLTMYYLMLNAIYTNPPFWWVLFSQSILALGIALPSAPASLGVYEGLNVAVLSVFGIQQEKALSMALILHAIQIITNTSIGGVGLIIQKQSFSKLFKDLSRKEGETEK